MCIYRKIYFWRKTLAFSTFSTHPSIIEQLKITLKNQDAVIHQRNSRDRQTDAPSADTVKQLSALIADKDQELKVRSLHVHKDVKFKRFFSVMPQRSYCCLLVLCIYLVFVIYSNNRLLKYFWICLLSFHTASNMKQYLSELSLFTGTEGRAW